MFLTVCVSEADRSSTCCVCRDQLLSSSRFQIVEVAGCKSGVQHPKHVDHVFDAFTLTELLQVLAMGLACDTFIG